MQDQDSVLGIDKNLSSVQFNVVNTTSSAITLDLFNLATLSNVPTTPIYIYPPQSVVGSFGSAQYNAGIASNNGFLYYAKLSTPTEVDVFDTNNNLVTTITFPASVDVPVYNSINNKLYISSSSTFAIYVVDCNTNTIITSFATTFSCLNGVFNSYTNTIYWGATSFGVVITDCTLNIEISTLPLPTPFVVVTYFVYNSNNNLIYFTDNGANDLVAVLDTQTNTYLPNITLPIGFGGAVLTLNEITNTLYLSSNDDIGIVDCFTNTFVSFISFPLGTGTFWGCTDTINNIVYFSCVNGTTIILNGYNNLVISNPFIGLGLVYTVFNAITYSVIYNDFIASSLVQFTTIGITATPYYVSGSTNYNLFLQSLEYEPIQVDYVRVIASQTQLANNVGIYKIDASGKSNQVPNFPILGVDAWQDQGNISLIKFKDLVFDGRTYINQYVINANETVTLELFYSQFDLPSFKNILQNIMPRKVPLKGFFDDYVEL